MNGNNATFDVKFDSTKEITTTMSTNELFGATFTEVIEKVPKNYGLITWNGTVLTVS